MHFIHHPTPTEARHARDVLNSPTASRADQERAADVIGSTRLLSPAELSDKLVRFAPRPKPVPLRFAAPSRHRHGAPVVLVIAGLIVLALIAIAAGMAFAKGVVGAEIAIEAGPEGR